MEYKIKIIIIYLRKSRGDEEDVLEKHRIRLTQYAESKGWKYIIKEEDVVSAERLSTRPVMLEILDILEEKECIYDGVLVAHYDRLSRGNSKDYGTIIEVFQYADKYIITPDRIYDTNDRNDLTMLGIQGVFANNELRTIVGRFIDGKKDGTRLGNWTNGKPPYPYEYQKKIIINERGKEVVTGTVIINEDKLQVYNQIKDLYLNKRIGTLEISFMLNREKILSPGNKTWSGNAVQRLLVHEFHLGKVIYGKNEWKKNRDNQSKLTKKRDEFEWVIGNGNHTPIKTQEEHDGILKILKQNTKIPKKSRAGIFPTSGLLYCKKCNHRMIYSYIPSEKKTGKQYYFTKCYYKTPTGEKCSQVGVKMNEDFYDEIFNVVYKKLSNEEWLKKINKNSKDNENIKKNLGKKMSLLEKSKLALNRIQTAFEEGEYELDEYSKRKSKRKQEIEIINKEIVELENDLNNQSQFDIEDLIKRGQIFAESWHKTESPKELNDLLKTVVKKIYYNRNDKKVFFEIDPLI